MKLESVVSISTVIFSLFAFGFSIFTFFSNKIEKDTMRLNQVVIEKKTNKILVGTTEVQYDVTLRNMSDTTIKDVHLIAPESITEIRGDTFQFENGHLTRLLLGDLTFSLQVSVVKLGLVLQNIKQRVTAAFHLHTLRVTGT